MFSYVEDNTPLWGFGLPVIALYGYIILSCWLFETKHPVVGVRSKYEARFVSNIRFYKNADAILTEGYNKVRSRLLL